MQGKPNLKKNIPKHENDYDPTGKIWYQMETSTSTSSVPTLLGSNQSYSYSSFMETDDDDLEVPSQAVHDFSMEKDIRQLI